MFIQSDHMSTNCQICVRDYFPLNAGSTAIITAVPTISITIFEKHKSYFGARRSLAGLVGSNPAIHSPMRRREMMELDKLLFILLEFACFPNTISTVVLFVQYAQYRVGFEGYNSSINRDGI
jgi:hypothetical protein